MIYLLYGNDRAKVREKLSSLLKTLFAKKPDASLIRVSVDEFAKTPLQEYVGVQGLFETKAIIVFDTLLSAPEHKTAIMEYLPELRESSNVFILLEDELDKKTLLLLTEHAEKVQEFSAPKKAATSAFNIFALPDAVGERNKKKAWVTYEIGKMHNVSSEEMHGMLFWGVKNMILSQEAKSAKDAGLSPFVYQKASRFSKNYSPDELHGLSKGLMELYHKARRGEGTFDIMLEKFILSLK